MKSICTTDVFGAAERCDLAPVRRQRLTLFDQRRRARGGRRQYPPMSRPRGGRGTVYGYMTVAAGSASAIQTIFQSMPIGFANSLRRSRGTVGWSTVGDFHLNDNLIMMHALELTGCGLVTPRQRPFDLWQDLTACDTCARLAVDRGNGLDRLA